MAKHSHLLRLASYLFLFVLFVLFALLAFAPSPAWAIGKTSTDLIENSKKHDQKEIIYQGEAVGDVMIRGSFAWVNVNDGVNAMGVWVKASEAKQIKYLGSYKFRGDIVRINGTFNRACREHGGDMDVHANDLKIVKSGHPVEHPVHREKLIVAIILFLLALVLFWWERKIIAKRRKTAPSQIAGDYCPYIPEEEK